MSIHRSEKPLSILIVDDQSVDLKVPYQIALSLGIEAHLAFDGNQALEFLRNSSVDLVILDWKMPVMGGAKLLKKLNSQSKRHGLSPVSVVLFTGEDPGQIVLSQPIGYQLLDIWKKPMAPLEIVKKFKQVREILKQRRVA